VQRRAEPLAAFLRRGLVPPPAQRRGLTAEERRGRELFSSPATRCASCHSPSSEYTDQSLSRFPEAPSPPGFEPEGAVAFKVPSLRHVGGTPPYFHDGRYPTLEELIEKNDDRMGRTRHLSAPDRAALIAFLRTL
jgi:cytochrome c peroxidase